MRVVPTWVWVLLSYLGLALLLLWPSVHSGITLVPADTITAVAPFGTSGRASYNPIVSDAAFQFYPWLKFFRDNLRRGLLPQWNPHILGGVQVTPNGYVSAYYPPFWTVAWLNLFGFYDAFVLFHLALAALGIYVFARLLGIRPRLAWVVGLMGFLASFWVHWSLHLVYLVGMVWLPWILAAIHLAASRPGRRTAAWMALVFGLWWLGGNPQYAYFGSLVAFAYASVQAVGALRSGTRQFGRVVTTLAAGFLLGGALAAPVLLPSGALRRQILRSAEPVEMLTTTHLPFPHLIRTLVNDAHGNPVDGVYHHFVAEFFMDTPFVGVTTVALAGAALGRWKSRERLFFIGGGLVVLVLAFTAWPHRVLHPWFPLYDSFRVSARWLSVLPALSIPLAALGLSDLTDGERRARFMLVVTGVVSLLAVAVWYGRLLNVPEAPHRYFTVRAMVALLPLAGAVLAGLVARRRPMAAVSLLALLVAGEAVFHTARWFPRMDQAEAYPTVAPISLVKERGGRLARVDSSYTILPTFSPNIPLVFGINDAQAQAVFFPRAYDRYLRIIQDHGAFTTGTNTAPPLVDSDLLGSPLLDALDVRTVLAPQDLVLTGHPLLHDGPPRVYGRTSPGPALVVPRAVPVTEEVAWQGLTDPTWDPRRLALVVGLTWPISAGEPGSAALEQSEPGYERWRVVAPSGGFLRVSASYDQGWKGRLDGQPIEVLKSDGIFRGVAVPPGTHVVEFVFRNRFEELGRVLALGSLLTILAFGFLPGPLLSRTARIPA